MRLTDTDANFPLKLYNYQLGPNSVILSILIYSMCLHTQSLSGHTSGIDSVSFDSSEVLVAAGAASGTIKLWDLEEAKSMLFIFYSAIYFFKSSEQETAPIETALAVFLDIYCMLSNCLSYIFFVFAM